MAEYIEREAFKEEVRRLSTHYLNEWDTLGVLAAADRIHASDVRPVVRGKWIWLGDCSNEGLYCSVCKNKIHEVRKPKKKLSNFCPNCGADMREESL